YHPLPIGVQVYDSGSVTERLRYIPVPALLCMQDVHRGEMVPWVVYGHRDGHSKAWPAVRMRGRGLIATFLLRFHDGLLANRCKAHTLRQCRHALGHTSDPPVAPRKTVAQWMQQRTGIDRTRCPQCGHQPLLRTPVPMGGGVSMPRAP